jgi:glycosyltransferase involved in cell wall biosynthesis
MDFEVTFFGDASNSELEDLYSQASIFSMTSVNFRKSVEGFGLVYLEAAANGLPIVANRVGGVAEAVSHGENGLLVEPGDQTGLTNAFARLIQDDDLREQMGNNGRKWSRRNNWFESAKLLFDDWDIEIDPTPTQPTASI